MLRTYDPLISISFLVGKRLQNSDTDNSYCHSRETLFHVTDNGADEMECHYRGTNFTRKVDLAVKNG